MESFRSWFTPVRGVALALASGLAGALSLAPACEGYTAPCSIVSENPSLLALPTAYGAGGFGGNPTVSLTADGDGSVTIVWLALALPDAGAASLGSPPTAPTSAEAVVVSGDGTVRVEPSFPAPKALSARQGNTTFVGADWTGQGVLFHWIEADETTSATGLAQVTATAKLQFVGAGGQVGPERTAVSCTMCDLAVSTATFGGGVRALFVGVPTLAPGAPSLANASYAIVSAAGELGARGDLPWLRSSLATLVTPPTLLVSGPDLLALAGSNLFRIDASFAKLAGPVHLPVATPAVDWLPGDAGVALAYTEPVALDGSVGIGVDPGLDFRHVTWVGSPVTPTTRISTADQVDALVADASGKYGVVFTTYGRDYFAELGRDGSKVGGDLGLGSGPAFTDGGPVLASTAPHLLRSPTPGHFVDVFVANGSLGRREVACAP